MSQNILKTERNQCEQKLDTLLAANSLVRKEVSPDGNCFFRASLLHVPYVKDENELRGMLCGLIIDNANEYVNSSQTSQEQPCNKPVEKDQNDVQNDAIENITDQQPITPSNTRKKVGRPRGTPPRKSHTFMTPPKKKLFKKRKATPEDWKKNIRKKLRMSWKEYVSQRGKPIHQKVVKSVDCSKCKYKCSQKITEENRQKIFDLFWSLESYERKKDFIISRIEEKQTRKVHRPKDITQKRKRNIHRSYFFDIGGTKTIVCKIYFKKTLDVGDAYIDNAMQNESGGVFIGADKRGKYNPHNKTKPEFLQKVRSHIESFPAVEGHYTRKSSNRRYLGAELNIPRMYQLYLDYYKEGISDTSISEDEKKRYYEHQQMKMRAREEKKKDKDKSKTTNDTFVATFDLQAVLQTPCSLVSQIYYMRKLNCYNLSIYNLGTKNATCYLWSEVEEKRGACEITTCLYLQMLSLTPNIKNVTLYSDACAGQNRNQFTVTGLMHAVINLPNIEIIDHKFLESGHTQMECDNMHSAIEFAKKKTEIYIPSQWATVVRMARTNPYSIIPIQHEDIYDFKKLQKTTLTYIKVDANGEKVNWLKIKWLRYSKQEPQHILFKHTFDEDFRRLRVIVMDKNGVPATNIRGHELPRNYNGKQPITLAKKDLLNLCKTKVIPAEYHKF
ncbi:unnamed protein product [Mytilus coruscus]|uniref:OTU domain-containing protein n=1 Tax=Mytilus coruscus TaxID=42192 RepID=A0A6J8E487_MYTCO|nr:unnamed protein product [Mytilus coruscus]